MAVRKAQRYTRAMLQKSAQETLKTRIQQKQIRPVDEKSKKAVVIAQEIKFARLLSSNDKKTRDRVVKNLRKWLTVRGQSSFAFTEADFMRLWKGLFYCMWMSDKPLIQEELAESLSKLVHCFKIKDVVLLYTACALRTLGIEWYGIDQYRLDKFCMLVRRIIRQTFIKCKEKSWDIKWIKGISELLGKVLVDRRICLGFSMHITELFLEELSKISNGNLPEDAVTELVRPFIVYLIPMVDERQIKHVMRHIFRYLIFQSNTGMDFMEKYRAWRDAGFPAGSIDAMERIELSDEEMYDNEIKDKEQCLQNDVKHDEEIPLDPRAGRVDVELPQIPFNAKQITALLEEYKFNPSSTTKSRRQLRRLIEEFTELSEGKMPLGVKKLRLAKSEKKDTDTKSAAMRLLQFEKDLYSDKPQKKRKRKLTKQLGQNESDVQNKKEERQDLDNIDNENNNNNDTVVSVGNEVAKKKRKIKHKVNYSDNVMNINSQNGISVKKEKNETKEKVQCNFGIDVQSNSNLKKGPSILDNTANESKKIKLKRHKITAAKMLDIITPVKKKKLPKLNTGKWDVSENLDSIAPLSFTSDSTEYFKETVEKSVSDVQKSYVFDKQPTWLTPALKKLECRKNRIPANLKEHKLNTENCKKRVKIALQRNTAQHTSEYILQIRKSPAIPFDANKKPLAGVLKASPIPSPINPFYKRNVV